MKLIFSHGKESGPWGTKINKLADVARSFNFDVDSIDYRDLMDPEARVERLLDRIQAFSEPCVLVGSSMGGYVSARVANKLPVAGLFLLAPALYMPGYEGQNYQPKCAHVAIVHGWQDDIIPVENSIRFAREFDTSLHLISGDHRLTDSLPMVESVFKIFLQEIKT